MSRRLINGRDWQLLTTAIGSGIRRFSSSRVGVFELLDEKNFRDLDVLLDEQLDEYLGRLWDSKNVVMNYEPLPLHDSCYYSGDVDVFTPSGPGSFHESLPNLLKSGMLLDTDDDTSMVQGGEGANWEFSGSTSTIVGPSSGSYSLSSVALVGNRKTIWDVCGYKRGNAGPSGGFFCLPYISSAELGMFLRYSSTHGCKFSSTWHHDVTHAIAATDPHIGSAGTLDLLASIFEHNKIPTYFTNAHTPVFFLLGGGYGRDTVPPILHKQIKMRASTVASVAFKRSLNQSQPKSFLRDSETKVHALVWFYSPEEGLGFHGMWVGEIDGNYVNCISNNLQNPLYRQMYPLVKEKVKRLPEDLLAEIEELWIGGRPPLKRSIPLRDQSINYVARQFLRHVVQGEVFTVDFDEYWQKATEFSKIFTNDLLHEIMNEDYDEGKYYDCEGLTNAFSNIYGKAVRITFINHKDYGVTPCKVVALMDNQYNRIDHVDMSCKYPDFRLNLGRYKIDNSDDGFC